ncbi:MAG: tetratricopeptide repeat protein [Deltaproteobacteria bacterium]|nr:tetratricopeptide repeat protein [Deltaproteobacteria bacterium]
MSRTHITVVRERTGDTVDLHVFEPEVDALSDIDAATAVQWLVEAVGDNPFLPGTTDAATAAMPLFRELARHAPTPRPGYEDTILGWLRYMHFLARHTHAMVASIEVEHLEPARPPGETRAAPNAMVTIQARDPAYLAHLSVGQLDAQSSPFSVVQQLPQCDAALLRLSPWSEADREPLWLHADCLLAFEPEHEGAHFAMGELFRVRREHEIARGAYLRSLARREDATAWARIAQCELALGRVDEALEHAIRAIALDAHLVEGLLRRAEALIALGRVEEAARDLRAGLALEPDASDLASLLARIAP